MSIYVEKYNIKKVDGKTFWGIKIDSKLNFNSHIDEIGKKKKQDRNQIHC